MRGEKFFPRIIIRRIRDREKGMRVPVKVMCDSASGHCDNCGKDLPVWSWKLGESIGCTKKCAIEDYEHELDEMLSDRCFQ
jgi:hypothetical protein